MDAKQMRCTPKYHGEERQDVGICPCNSDCFHWKACLKELNIEEAMEDRWQWRYPLREEDNKMA